MARTLRLTVLLITLCGCVGCDQATKSLARLTLSPGRVTSLLHDVIRLQLAENPGAFLSLGGQLAPGIRELLFTVGGTLLVSAVLLWALFARRPDASQTIAAALVGGGGLGNLIDRFLHGGYVTDFLNLGIGDLRTGIFNVADVSLMVGVVLLLAGSGRSRTDRPGTGHRCALVLVVAWAATGVSRDGMAADAADPPAPPAVDAGMAHMAGHMTLTVLRPLQPGDRERAAGVVAAARTAMAPYRDYHQALADGYRIFLPDVPQTQYHFTRYDYGLASRTHFDPAKPTSLLYTKTADGGYRLVGAMYTDRVDATEDELDARVPLSVARWHQHTNFCKAPPGEESAYFGPAARFGLLGSIVTKQDCEAAGGKFYPHFFGWMVHVYPDETDAARIWSIDDDDQGHDNMDHSSMPGMSMPGMTMPGMK